MTDHYDEMRVAPDASQAEELRQQLHARMANVSRDDQHGRARLHVDTGARVRPARSNEGDRRAPGYKHHRNGKPPAHGVGWCGRRRVIGVTGLPFAVTNSNADDDESPSPAAVAAVAPTTNVAPTTTAAPAMETVRLNVGTNGAIPVTLTAGTPESSSSSPSPTTTTTNAGETLPDS